MKEAAEDPVIMPVSSPTSDAECDLSSSNDALSGDNGVVAEGMDVLTSKGSI